MKIKGFTLIELLAVIVILAIIALIATPIILNIIGSSKNSAVLRSGELYLKAVNQAVARQNLKGEFNPSSCEIQSDGNLLCDGTQTLVVETDGSRPIKGTITFSKGKVTNVTEMILDGNELQTNDKGGLIVKGVSSNEEPKVELNPQGTYLMTTPTVSSSDTYFLGQEQIKRNQVESIAINNTKSVPSNAIYSWDASASKDSSVMAWYVDTNNNNLYELYIGGDGGVKANPDSSYLFGYFTNITSLDVTYLDTSEVTDMGSMFFYCIGVTNLDLSNFDTREVTNMSNMFNYCSSLTSLNVSVFDTSQVTNMSQMFSKCSNLPTLNISNFNTSNVISMTSMFERCNNLTNIIGLNKFDTSKVTEMSGMFYDCSNLTSLNLSSFDTNKVTNMFGMFGNCIKLKTIDIRNAVFTSVTTNAHYDLMLTNLSVLETIMVKDNDAKTFIEARLTDASKTGVTVSIAS